MYIATGEHRVYLIAVTVTFVYDFTLISSVTLCRRVYKTHYTSVGPMGLLTSPRTSVVMNISAWMAIEADTSLPVVCCHCNREKHCIQSSENFASYCNYCSSVSFIYRSYRYSLQSLLVGYRNYRPEVASIAVFVEAVHFHYAPITPIRGE